MSELDSLADEMERNVPVLEVYEPTGQFSTDPLKMCLAWRRMRQFSAEEGLVALGYTDQSPGQPRLHQFVKMHMVAPSCGMFLKLSTGCYRWLCEAVLCAGK